MKKNLPADSSQQAFLLAGHKNEPPFATIAPIGWGVSWLLLAKASRKMDLFQTQFIFQLIGIPMFFVLLPFIAPGRVANVLLLIGLGILVTFTYTLYFRALRSGQLAIIAPIYESYIVVTVFLSVVFLHDSFGLLKLVAIIALIVGVAFLGLQIHSLRKKKIETFAGVIPAVIAASGTGFFVFFTGISSRMNGWFNTALGIRIVIPVAIVVLFIMQRKKLQPLFKNIVWKWIIPAAIADVVAFSMFNYTLRLYEVSYVTIMSAAAPLVSTVLAIIFLREKLTMFQIIGFILVMAGIVALNIV